MDAMRDRMRERGTGLSRTRRGLSDADYGMLLRFRTDLRRFLRWSEGRAREAGLTPMQHQLLLAIRGTTDPRGPTIQDAAHVLLLQHNSAVELAERTERAGLIRRVPDREDRRVVRLRLTPLGSRRLGRLAESHLEELGRLRAAPEQPWPAG
jgi:DNA-binding MarR family transcriptional regulator